MVNNVFLGLGSNLGDRKKLLSDAIEKIGDEHTIVEKISSLYETSPYGNIKQDNFLNIVIRIVTNYSIEKLFERMKIIEKALGRKNTILKWGPREIDIDILFYNDLIYNSDNVIIPHPEILMRDFVLLPLIEIAPDYIHPVIKKKLDEIDISKIEKHIISKI